MKLFSQSHPVRTEGPVLRTASISATVGALGLAFETWESANPSSALTRLRRFWSIRFWSVAILSAILCIPLQAQSPRADAQKDPILSAMLVELDRSVSQLQLPGFQKPFFIQYRLEDVDAFETRAAFGATQGAARNHNRIARVTVLVGDYKTDSS